ncbi:site-specific integrase [Frankia sp. AgW1.1]|uniref:tyrosine-type recombinase/integrase n=1 Tax=Frankia sp. AgW1.1 TaxID=1836971 RepID=UPI0019344126|nr:site-specific integrase [Frankia sp. AgW1.1]MBL7487168.1 site-specific integrase [Frankia sp. AgW1.1]
MSVKELDPTVRTNPKTGKTTTTRRWQARYYDANSKEHARNFDKKTDAEKWERDQRAAVRAGSHTDPALGQQTFGTFTAKWLKAKRRLRETTREDYTRTIDNRFTKLDARRMRSITKDDIEALVDSWQAPPLGAAHGPLEASTIEVTFGILKAIFTAAFHEGVVSRNPCVGVELPEVLPGRLLLPTTEQFWQVIDHLPAHFQSPVMLMGGCGPRIGEALGLCEDRVGWDTDEITFDQQWNVRTYQLAPLKRGTRGRTVPAPSFVVDALKADRKRGVGAHGLLYWSDQKPTQPWHYGSLRNALAKAGTKAGLPDLDPHDLRHLYASVLISGGENVTTVSYLLGHATPQITLSIYAHLWERDDSRARSRIESALGRPASRTDSAKAA